MFYGDPMLLFSVTCMGSSVFSTPWSNFDHRVWSTFDQGLVNIDQGLAKL